MNKILQDRKMEIEAMKKKKTQTGNLKTEKFRNVNRNYKGMDALPSPSPQPLPRPPTTTIKNNRNEQSLVMDISPYQWFQFPNKN